MKIHKAVTLLILCWILVLPLSGRLLLSPVKAAASNPLVVSIESMALPVAADRSFCWFDDQMYYAGNNDHKIYQYSSSTWGAGTWSEVVDTSVSSGAAFMYSDKINSIFAQAYVNATHCRWYYTDDGTTWTYTESLHYTATPTFGSAWYGNGTILITNYADPDFMGIQKSDDWGENWAVWKNFTDMFPYAGQIVQSPYGGWRHCHTICRSGDFIAATVGDSYRAVVASHDGGDTWAIERYGAPTGSIALPDRVLFTGDIHEGMLLYNTTSQLWKDVKVAGWNMFISYHPTYDSVNDVVYVGLSRANGTHGIVASPDRGESWVTAYQWAEGAGEMYAFPYYHDGYVYFIIDGNATLRRFPALTNQAVRSLSNDQITTALYGQTFYYDFGDASQVADVQVTWTQHPIINELDNGDMEDGSVSDGFPNMYALNWDSSNRSYAVVDAVGINGTKGIQWEFRDGGQELTARMLYSVLEDRPRIEYNESVVLVGYVKSNITLDATFLRAKMDWINSTGTNIDGGTSFYNLPTLSTEWTKLVWYCHSPVIDSSDHFRPILYMRLLGRYNEDWNDLPWTTLWFDNLTMYPVLRSSLWYEPSSPHQVGAGQYNTFCGMDWQNPLWRYVANGTQMNTETPVVRINDQLVTNGTILRAARSPLKVEVVEGGCLTFTFSTVDTYLASDAAITSVTMTDLLWTVRLFAGSGQTSTTTFYAEHRPSAINGVNSWSYSQSSQQGSFTVTHSSEEEVELWWTYSESRDYVIDNAYLALGISSIAFMVMIGVGIIGTVKGGSMDELLIISGIGLSLTAAMFVVLMVLQAFRGI